MLILLPPSEGKAAPSRGKALDLASLSSPALTDARSAVLDALVALSAADVDAAAATLGLGATQTDLAARNATLRTAPTARAEAIYTGVLYDALDLASLDAAARRRLGRVAVTSSVFGIVRPADRIPSYRLSGDVTLPGLGSVAGHWRTHLGPAVVEAVGTGLLVDLRSGTYAAFWRPSGPVAARTVTVRVLHEHQGRRKVVSHFNKATKGRIVRAVLADGGTPRTPGAFATQLRDLGWDVEEGAAGARGTELDVVVRDL
ncbi:peroxide stress protein YaaA [Nocardioides zeae]|uniref:Peroxide stress protein YaaA n=1 Tax=Nocardioides imazamoxiresistens TaxID=3231893 RepID=A0ABU3Q1L5_9ACTN|nr:peroxide stress protein YaaA [Nocardioides zeae]MDT9595026.1 peroxide stress protein YaaA [Nocardioides zeae]